MKTMIDITNLSDAALEVVIRSKTEPFVSAEHLSNEERRQAAEALGWEMTPYVLNWIATPHQGKRAGAFVDTFDYEGAILDRQDKFYND